MQHLRFVGLAELANRSAAALTLAARKRLEFAKGLAMRPRLLLVDELSLGLAPVIVDELCETLRMLNAEGMTILVVEQDVATALELASTAFVMDTGRVTRGGPSAALRDDPAIREAYLGTI